MPSIIHSQVYIGEKNSYNTRFKPYSSMLKIIFQRTISIIVDERNSWAKLWLRQRLSAYVMDLKKDLVKDHPQMRFRKGSNSMRIKIWIHNNNNCRINGAFWVMKISKCHPKGLGFTHFPLLIIPCVKSFYPFAPTEWYSETGIVWLKSSI